MKKLLTPSSPLALYAANPPRRDAQQWTSSDPLVLGHALGSSHEMWRGVVELLPATQPVILWDLPGHGGSDLLSMPSPDAEDVARALNNALRDLGVDRAHIGGLSLGALISLGYSQLFAEQTLTLAMMDSGPANTPSSAWIEKAESVESHGIAPLAAGTMERWFTTGFASGGGAAEVARIKEIFLETDPAGYAQCCRVLANTDLWPGLSRAQMPSLVLTGALDAGFTPEAAESLARYLPEAGSPVIVADARHQTAVEHPEVVARALNELVVGSL